MSFELRHLLNSKLITQNSHGVAVAKERLPIIRASEIGEYVYCARAWWLRRVAGLEPAGRERREYGTLLHRRHGRVVAGSRALLFAAVVLVLAAIVLMLAGR